MSDNLFTDIKINKDYIYLTDVEKLIKKSAFFYELEEDTVLAIDIEKDPIYDITSEEFLDNEYFTQYLYSYHIRRLDKYHKKKVNEIVNLFNSYKKLKSLVVKHDHIGIYNTIHELKYGKLDDSVVKYINDVIGGKYKPFDIIGMISENIVVILLIIIIILLTLIIYTLLNIDTKNIEDAPIRNTTKKKNNYTFPNLENNLLNNSN